jgi:hypothetical protein
MGVQFHLPVIFCFHILSILTVFTVLCNTYVRAGVGTSSPRLSLTLPTPPTQDTCFAGSKLKAVLNDVFFCDRIFDSAPSNIIIFPSFLFFLVYLLIFIYYILFLFSTDFNSYGPVTIAETTAHRIKGRLAAPKAPGLGVEPLYDVLGSPIMDIC